MLLELRVENYAVIDSVAVEFAAGLNLLTGETGAGKSILIDALALLLGEKASGEAIRHGTDKAVVAAVFELHGSEEKAAGRILEANGIDLDSDQVIVRREIQAGGSGRVFIYNQPATVAVLKQLAPVSCVGPRAARVDHFLRRKTLVSICSTPSPEPIAPPTQLPSPTGRRFAIASPIWNATNRIACAARPLDLPEEGNLSADLQPGEDEKLEAEKRVLANAESIYERRDAAHTTRCTKATLRPRHRFARVLVSSKTCRASTSNFAMPSPELESARITVEDIGARAARLCRGHRVFTRAAGGGRRPPGRARPPEAQIRPHARTT